MEEKKKHPGGRPSKYNPAMCAKVIEIMEQGGSLVEAAGYIGVNKDTLNEWRKEHPEFSDAVKEGIAKSEHWWQGQGRVNLENPKFNATLWYMNMKNRFGWADKQEVKNTGEIKIVIQRLNGDTYPL